jgi:hypothetical protein
MIARGLCRTATTGVHRTPWEVAGQYSPPTRLPGDRMGTNKLLSKVGGSNYHGYKPSHTE